MTFPAQLINKNLNVTGLLQSPVQLARLYDTVELNYIATLFTVTYMPQSL